MSTLKSARLHKHPQVKRVIDVKHVWMFTCARCGGNFYLWAAYTQTDGSLTCWSCGDGQARLLWCLGCQRGLPEERFIRPLRDDFDPDSEYGKRVLALRALSRRPGPQYGPSELLCEECRGRPEPARECAKCGQEFTPRRSDARFCSSRCRVAAHRAAKVIASPDGQVPRSPR